MATLARIRRVPRAWVLAGLLLASIALLLHMTKARHSPGCSSYRPVAGISLVAHAGGGLPDRMYPNSIAALDRSYGNGIRIFEMDFHELPFGVIRTGHDWYDVFEPDSAWLSDVIAWFRLHRDARLITDVKTSNERALKLIATSAPDLGDRIMPFVFSAHDYFVARALGFRQTIFRTDQRPEREWLQFVNQHPMVAVALRRERLALRADIRHPIMVYVLDKPPEDGTIRTIVSDCLIPSSPLSAGRI